MSLLMSMRRRVAAAVAVMGLAVAVGLADDFSWTGNGSSDNMNEGPNWGPASFDDWPGKNQATDDSAVIDDPNPRPTAKMVESLQVVRLFVGDGHTIDTTASDPEYVLTVHVPTNNTGEARFEGAVKLDGTGRITADYVLVYSDDENTTIEYDGTGAGNNDYVMLDTQGD